MNKEKWLHKLNMQSWFYIIGLIILIFFNYVRFDPTEFFRILSPILIVSSFAFLGILAISEIRHSIKEYSSKKTNEILREIEGLRKRQITENLEDQIITDKDILNLRESLRNFKNNYFERYITYSTILFAFTLLSTFVNFGLYIDISNMVVMVIFFLWGLFYFCQMLKTIFISMRN